MTRRLKVIVIGAGIGGLAAARALALRGHQVELHERSAQLGEVGAGLQLGPNAVKILYALGLKDELHRVACAPDCTATLRWDDGAFVHHEHFQDAFAQYGAPYLVAHRADLHGLLMRSVDPAAIHVSRRCMSASSTSKGAVAHFADGRAAEGDVVIGADGIHSVVRDALWGETTARYTHYLGWRGILPMEQALAAMDDDNLRTLHRKDVVMWRSPTGTALFYPLRAGKLINVFAGRFTDEWADESWTVPSTPAEMIAAFEGWHPTLLRVLNLVEECYKWAFFDRDPLPRWSKDHITLMGDAAHAMMPTLAQGAAITIEDAYVLARCLDSHAQPTQALAAYEAERIGRAHKAQLMSRRQFDDNRKVPRPPPLSRSWIYEYDATAEAPAQDAASA
jgi:salicylate hydroxylase